MQRGFDRGGCGARLPTCLAMPHGKPLWEPRRPNTRHPPFITTNGKGGHSRDSSPSGR